MKMILMVVGFSSVLTGCFATGNNPYVSRLGSSGYPVTYQSFPESATVVCDGITKGQTPVMVIYAHDRQTTNAGDSLTVDRCKAVWMSGAEADYPETVTVNLQPRGSVIGASRPQNVAGLQKDMAFDHAQKSSDLARKAQEEALRLEREKLALEKARRDQLENLNDYLENEDHSGRYPSLQTYSKDAFDVYYGKTKVEGARASSFVVLKYGYAKDTWDAYYRGIKIVDARGNSFEVLHPNYAKDTWNVYYRGLKIEGANASTFSVESNGYARDSGQRYYHGKNM